MKSGIYKIRNISNNHIYVGSAVNIKSRWSSHKAALKKQTHHGSYLQRAWNKYGAECFEFSVIELCEKEKLIEREQYYIDTLHPEYNMAKIAGSSLGIKRSKDFCKGVSKRMKGKKFSPDQVRKASRSKLKKIEIEYYKTLDKEMGDYGNEFDSF